MLRRDLFKSVSVVALVGAFAGCSAVSPAQDISQAVSDLQLIAQSFTAALPAFSRIVGINSQSLSQIQSWIANITAAASGIASAANAAAAQPFVQQVESDLNAIVGALSGLPLPAPISTVLAAAGVLLPVVEAAVGLALPPSSPARSLAARRPMTPDQARAALRSI